MGSARTGSEPLERWKRRRSTMGYGRHLGFGTRLLLAGLVTMGVVGVVGYVLIADQLRQSQIDNYATAQRADVRSFEAIGRRGGSTSLQVARIDRLLDAITERPGTLETLLIDPRSVVVAAGNDDSAVGKRDSDERIRAAFRAGTSYAGLEGDPRRSGRDFEFISPVRLPAGRYVAEMSYDHRFLDANLRDVRSALRLIGLLALVGGAGVFYLVGGRKLLRSHRFALSAISAGASRPPISVPRPTPRSTRPNARAAVAGRTSTRSATRSSSPRQPGSTWSGG